MDRNSRAPTGYPSAEPTRPHTSASRNAARYRGQLCRRRLGVQHGRRALLGRRAGFSRPPPAPGPQPHILYPSFLVQPAVTDDPICRNSVTAARPRGMRPQARGGIMHPMFAGACSAELAMVPGRAVPGRSGVTDHHLGPGGRRSTGRDVVVAAAGHRPGTGRRGGGVHPSAGQQAGCRGRRADPVRWYHGRNHEYTGLYFVPALVALTVGGVKLWREQPDPNEGVVDISLPAQGPADGTDSANPLTNADCGSLPNP